MKNDRFEFFTSLLIALVTIFGAITAWRASVASIEADDADFDGLSAGIRAQEAIVLNSVEAYEHLRAFTSYYRYNALGDGIPYNGLSDEDRERSELYGIALGLQYSFFPSRYLDKDGNYDIQRELDELWAESNSLQDLNPETHFLRGDLLRDKANYLTLSLIVFATSFLFFALSQAFSNFLRYPFAALGGITLIGALCAILIFEFTL